MISTKVLSILVLLLAVYIGWYYYPLYEHLGKDLRTKLLPSKHVSSIKHKLFTNEELQIFNGVDRPEMYLSILGTVFDVSKGAKHYGPGKDYNIFVGRDTSRSFITGEFCTEDSSDRVDDLSSEDLKSLEKWIEFYKKEYTEMGKLIGTYYDEFGELTEYHANILKLFEEARKSSEANKLQKMRYPPCNVEWSQESGTRVWCTHRSGGIARSWIGVPRQLYEVGSKSHRCACIREDDDDFGNLKEYPDCPKDSASCFVKET